MSIAMLSLAQCSTRTILDTNCVQNIIPRFNPAAEWIDHPKL